MPTNAKEFNKFIAENKGKVVSYLKMKYSLSNEDYDDIYQESSIALFQNIKNKKIENRDCALSTYFLKVCINQTLKFLNNKHTVSLFDDRIITSKEDVKVDKLDELLNICDEYDPDNDKQITEEIVRNIIDNLPAKCHNIFWGYYWGNLSNETIAEMFGFANANTVKAEKYKCVSKFKQKFYELKKENENNR